MSASIRVNEARMHRLSYRDRVRIQTLRRDCAWTLSRIGLHMGIPTSTIASVIINPATPRKPTGRPILITTPIKNHLINFVTSSAEARCMTYAQLIHETGIVASERTIRRVLQSAGFQRCVAMRKPLLSEEAKRKRLT